MDAAPVLPLHIGIISPEVKHFKEINLYSRTNRILR